MSPPGRLARSVDPVAAGWGGLVAAIGPIAATGRGWPVVLALTAASFGLGGFLAGVRSVMRRPLHAMAAALVGIGLHLLFGALTWLLDAAGGPGAANLTPEPGAGNWLRLAVWALAWAALGGLVVSGLLGGQQRRMRSGR